MTKQEKRLEKIRQNPKTVTFQELRQVLDAYGFELRPSSGTSHHFFRAEIGDRSWRLSIPFKKPHIKEVYVKKALQAIDEIIEVQSEIETEDDDGNE